MQAAPMSLRPLLQSLFGRDWARLAGETLSVRADSIYRWSCRKRPLLEHEAMLLLAKVQPRRRQIEKEWQQGLAAAGRLMFDWARHERMIHLDREMREQLDQLSAAEASLCATIASYASDRRP